MLNKSIAILTNTAYSVGMDTNGAAIRAIRERSGVSVTELAKRAEIGQPHLSNIESGRRVASRQLAQRLADSLDVPLTAILALPRAKDVAWAKEVLADAELERV